MIDLGGPRAVILKVGWKEKAADGTFPTEPLYRQVDLPRCLASGVGRAVARCVGGGDVCQSAPSTRGPYPEPDFGNLSAKTPPAVVHAALAAARLDGWEETWPADMPPTVYVSSN